jgi:hypothetical protein
MKETNAPPRINVKIPMNIMKLEKTAENPTVSFPSAVSEIPRPILLLKRRINRVAATHSVRLIIMRLV